MSEWETEIRARLAGLSLEPMREKEIVDELAQHLEDRYRELRACGTSEAAARNQTIAELDQGDLIARKLRPIEGPGYREMIVLGARRKNMLGDLWQDLKFGARMLIKNPGFTLVVLLTLAVGIGANTAIFTVVNAVMLRPLPFAEPQHLVRLWESNPERGWPQFSVSQPNFLDWHAQNQSFEFIAAYGGASFNAATGGDVEVIRGTAVTRDFFRTLRTTPALGRDFLPEEDRPGGNRVVLLTHGFWQRRLGGDPEVLSRSATLNDNSFVVVGVLPQSFDWGGPEVEVFVPLQPNPNQSRGDHRLGVIGRLKPGVTLDQSLADMNTLAGQLGQQYPESNRGWSVTALSFYDWIVPQENRKSLLVFIAAVAFVLLIACINVANLLLARATVRQREVAIRVAIGASRSRIFRQLLVESLLLALIAGALGLGLSALAVKVLKGLNPNNLPRLDEVSLDVTVLLFSLLVSLLTGVLFGLIPAIHASRPNLNDTLKEGGRSGSGGARQRARGVLVVAEVALSVVLLAGAGLLLRSFWLLQEVKPGFDPDRLLTLRINLPRSRYENNDKAFAFYNRLVSEVGSLPASSAASITSQIPLDPGNTSTELTVPGKDAPPDGSKPSASWRIVGPGYFQTMGIPLRGRDFDSRDTGNGEPVAIISDELARRSWPGEDPIGKTILVHSFGQKLRTVIGVVGDVRSFGLDVDAPPVVYASLGEAALWNPMHLIVRTTTEPSAQVGALREVFRSVDGAVPVYNIRTLDEIVSTSLAQRRFTMFLLITFAGLALLLACVGLFGVMAYVVSQRTHEIGIRLALGARRLDVFRIVVGRGMLFATIGSLLGAGGALALGVFAESLLAGLLFQVTATDPLAFVGSALLLLAVAFWACYVPALRATKVDPITALRYE